MNPTHKNTRSLAQIATTSQFCVPCLSNNIPNCAVTILAEAKATALLASHTVTKIQWSLVAYSQIMDRISIARGATYADDKNICQYVCGLNISVGEPRQSNVLSKYFTFTIQCLGYLTKAFPYGSKSSSSSKATPQLVDK